MEVLLLKPKGVNPVFTERLEDLETVTPSFQTLQHARLTNSPRAQQMSEPNEASKAASSVGSGDAEIRFQVDLFDPISTDD